jgi:hypothetical protein
MIKIERLAQRFRLAEAENSFRAMIPKANHTLGVSIDNPIIRRFSSQGQTEFLEIDTNARGHSALVVHRSLRCRPAAAEFVEGPELEQLEAALPITCARRLCSG